jgi:hypothetical protein
MIRFANRRLSTDLKRSRVHLNGMPTIGSVPPDVIFNLPTSRSLCPYA